MIPMMKVRRVMGLAVLLALLVSASGTPDPEVHHLVPRTWGSPVEPTLHDVAYGPERGCPWGSDALCGGSQELDIYRVRAGGNRGTLVYIHGGGYVFGRQFLRWPTSATSSDNCTAATRSSRSTTGSRRSQRDANGDPVLVRAGPIGWPFPQTMGENGFRPAMTDVAAALNWVDTRAPALRTLHRDPRRRGTLLRRDHGGTRRHGHQQHPIHCSPPYPPSTPGSPSPLRSTGTRSRTEPAGGQSGWATSPRPTRIDRTPSPTSTRPTHPATSSSGSTTASVPVQNVRAFHRHARSMGVKGDLGLMVDIVDRLADGRPMLPSAIGQPDPRNHCPIGGMNAAWFDLWLDDR